MATDASLDGRKQALARRFEGADFRPLFDLVVTPLARLGRFGFRKEPFPSWLVISGLVPLILGAGWIAGVLAGERPVFEDALALSVAGAVLAAATALGTNVLTRQLKNTLLEAILPAITRPKDLDLMEAGMERIFDLRRQLAFTIVGGFGLFLFMMYLREMLVLMLPTSHWAVVLQGCLVGAAALYFAAPMLSFLPKLGRMDLGIYQINPRDSIVIISLVNSANRVLYVFTGLCMLISIGAARVGLLAEPQVGVALLLGLWVPLTVNFVGAHATFRSMIIRTKWRYLDGLQDQIDELLEDPRFPEDGTLDKVNVLREHHDSICKTPNSTIDFRAWLNYLNSLLLPFLAGALANLQQVLSWLGLSS